MISSRSSSFGPGRSSWRQPNGWLNRDPSALSPNSAGNMRTPEQFVNASRKHLRDILRMSGVVLYSAASTLRPGDVYLLGHNPGGDAENTRVKTVGGSLDELPTTNTNSYLQSWNERAAGEAPLQLRVIWLLERLGFDPREVAASNLIFARSRDAARSQFRRLSAIWWPVHEEILDIVRPRLVIAYGNFAESPYKFLLDKFTADAEDSHPSGHGVWACRTFLVPGRFRVAGIPHLSRYKISAHDHVAEWIKRLSKPRRAAQE